MKCEHKWVSLMGWLTPDEKLVCINCEATIITKREGQAVGR
jgi:hypothetical protein